MEILRDILKSRRTEAKLSQQEIADKINIAQTYYSDIERGRTLPGLKTCLKLAVVLGFNMEDLKESVREELR